MRLYTHIIYQLAALDEICMAGCH